VGITNLKQALQNKMGLWAGELNDREKKVAEILSLYESLPEHNARAERLRTVLDCAGVVMREIDPTWSPATVKPSRPNVHKNGVKLGNTTKLALDILRDCPTPRSSRELAIEVIKLDGAGDMAPDQVQRVANAVDAGLRAKVGTLVAHDNGRPRRWRIEISE
jgi:hypothetical protein